MTEGYLTIEKLAAYSSLSRATLRTLVRSGEIPCLRLKRKILVRQSDFDFWARRRQQEHRRCSPLVSRLADEILGRIA